MALGATGCAIYGKATAGNWAQSGPEPIPDFRNKAEMLIGGIFVENMAVVAGLAGGCDLRMTMLSSVMIGSGLNTVRLGV